MRAQLSLVARYLATGLGRAEAEAAVESLKQAIAQRPQYHIPRMEIACGLASNADSSA